MINIKYTLMYVHKCMKEMQQKCKRISMDEKTTRDYFLWNFLALYIFWDEDDNSKMNMMSAIMNQVLFLILTSFNSFSLQNSTCKYIPLLSPHYRVKMRYVCETVCSKLQNYCLNQDSGPPSLVSNVFS